MNTGTNRMQMNGFMMFVLFAAVFLSACAGPKLNVEPIAVSEDPIDQVNRLDSEISAAQKNQVNVLAPSNFERAEEYLNSARKGIESRSDAKDILEKVSYGRAQLKRSEELAQLTRTDLAAVIKARDFARSAGAANFEKEYADVESEFLKLTKAAESGDASWAKKRQDEVAETYRQLELRAIKTRTLGEVRDLIAQAEKKDAQKIAPKTLAKAKNSYKEVDNFRS